jgi:beta-glucosidase
MTLPRRRFLLAAGAAATASAWSATPPRRFPKGFLWGAATSGYQVEDDDDDADVSFLETVTPTLFGERAGKGDMSFTRWAQDLDLVRSLGLNSYRFSLEWPRIEPEPGRFSAAALDHYKAVVDGCRARGLEPLVTFNHYTTPIWFAKKGGWLQPDAPDLFARFCDRAARHLGAGIGRAMTLNEPNIMRILRYVLPPQAFAAQRAMLEAAARKAGTPKFVAGNAVDPADVDLMTTNLVAGHRAGRAAIKAIRPDLPVGFTLSMFDDTPVAGGEARRDQARQDLYGIWLAVAREDDFMGVQNYERVLWGPDGRVPPAPGATLNASGGEVYAPSVANAVRYAHGVAGRPVLVTEHGVATPDDGIRQRLIPAALAELGRAMDEGVPVLGYVHWSLLDNYEWIAGYKQQLGLVAVDRTTFRRTPKPSAGVLARIARANSL